MFCTAETGSKDEPDELETACSNTKNPVAALARTPANMNFQGNPRDIKLVFLPF